MAPSLLSLMGTSLVPGFTLALNRLNDQWSFDGGLQLWRTNPLAR